MVIFTKQSLFCLMPVITSYLVAWVKAGFKKSKLKTLEFLLMGKAFTKRQNDVERP